MNKKLFQQKSVDVLQEPAEEGKCQSNTKGVLDQTDLDEKTPTLDQTISNPDQQPGSLNQPKLGESSCSLGSLQQHRRQSSKTSSLNFVSDYYDSESVGSEDSTTESLRDEKLDT